MEASFQRRFDGVRIHHDGVADAQDARAVTIGEDIHLSAGEDLAGAGAPQLIAHELAHVVQQRGADRRGSARALEREADQAGAAAAAGRTVRIDGRAGGPTPQPQKKVAPPPPSGNILYVGMNNADPEVKALLGRYKGTPVSVTVVKGTKEEAAATFGTGATFDLTADTGLDALVAALTTDTSKHAKLKALLKSQSASDRDDLAHVMKVYADTEADGKDRMTRVVLSGHSGGMGVFGSSGEVYFKGLVELASIFPRAANQTKHVIVAGCHTGDETTILDYYVKAFPSLLTVWAWWDACPTGPGAAAAIVRWAGLTERGQKTIPAQGGGISTYSGGTYSGAPSGKASPATVLASIRGDDARFQDYFDGTRADPSPHGGWLEAYYGRAFTAARRADVTGADHDEMELKRQRALLLRYWKNVAKNFWKANGSVITKGYGTAAAPDYPNLSRKGTLAAIAAFGAAATATGTDRAAAEAKLLGLKTLDPVLVPDSMVAEP